MANVLTPQPRTQRIARKPQHRFQIEHRPFQIQPFMIAPVLPGETLKNLLLQTRCVTDPIKNKLVGWWIEHYFFYVKHRDLLAQSDLLQNMMLDLQLDTSSLNSAASVPYNHFGGTFNWLKWCNERIVDTYFRMEGETALQYAIDGLPAAAINTELWAQSAALSDVYQLDVPTLTVGGDDSVTAQEVDTLMQTWQFLRANNMTQMTYEDWLGTYGISTPTVEINQPELIRYVREWQYPSNTINPTDGSAASAVSWAVSERGDKDRFFREPGFIVGLTVARPKVYLKNLDGNGVGMLNNALAWLPPLMSADPWTSLKKYSDTAGPLASVVTDTDGYWVDVRDLFLYGDEYINVAKTATNLNLVALPNAGLTNKYYPSQADVEGLFVGATADKQKVRQDGIVTLNILGTQQDTTPLSSSGN